MQSTKNSKNISKSKYRKEDNKKQKKNLNLNECNIQSTMEQGEHKTPNIADMQTLKEQSSKSCDLNINRKNIKCTSKTIETAAFVNNAENIIEEEKNNRIALTDRQKQNIEKILGKLFSVNILNQNENCSKSLSLPSDSASKDSHIMENLSLLSLLNQNCNSMKQKFKTTKEKENYIKNMTDDINESLGNSDDEYVEYVFKPREYFFFSMCQLCKKELKELALPCKKCFMTYYCSIQHMLDDKHHKEFCSVLKKLEDAQGGHIFAGANNMSSENFRNFRVQMLRMCEEVLKRNLELYEKEIILYPRICCKETCREWRYNHLTNCEKCQQVAFCKNNPTHLSDSHGLWCNSFSIMAKLIPLHGNTVPDMPTGIFKNNFDSGITMKNLLNLLYNKNEIDSDVTFANISQYATSPLTVWYGIRLCEFFHKQILNIHIVGAEFHFEANTLQKWEYFFFHLTPKLKELNIVFIGPELFIPGVSFELLSKIRMCEMCRTLGRKINFKFENSLYHDYYKLASYVKPDLICFFNPGLYRFTGFENADTWAETIRISAMEKCPIIVTSYTEYESPLDLKRFLMEAQRCVKIILPPSVNPFSSMKPERNFISDDIVPLIFKNFYCFIVQ